MAMKKGNNILFIILGVIIVFLVIDNLVGYVFKVAYNNTKYGVIHRQNYCLNESNDDILILGSSEAAHNYVSSVFEDTLGMTCFNAGSDGMCIYYYYTVLACRIERGAAPKLVILDYGDADLLEIDDPTAKIESCVSRLAPYYGDYQSIRDLANDCGPYEKIKFVSHMYRYNSQIIQMCLGTFYPTKENKGYEPVSGSLPNNEQREQLSLHEEVIEEGKIEYISKLINLCSQNGIKLIIVRSPKYYENPSPCFNVMKEIAEKKGIPYYDLSGLEEAMQPSLFRDISHLNNEGANAFSKHFVGVLSEYLKGYAK
jgi:hypothetical protein